MATQLTHKLEREIATTLPAKADGSAAPLVAPPFIVTVAPEGLAMRVKGGRVTHGPISWERAFAWLVRQNTDDVIRSEHLAASVAEHNPTFDRHEASTVPLADEMSVGGYDD